MKDLHEDCGVLKPDAPCRTYRCSLNHDDKCVFCGFDFHAHLSEHGRRLMVVKGPRKKRGKITPRKVLSKVGRNELCSCGSGLKFKNCCKK